MGERVLRREPQRSESARASGLLFRPAARAWARRARMRTLLGARRRDRGLTTAPLPPLVPALLGWAGVPSTADGLAYDGATGLLAVRRRDGGRGRGERGVQGRAALVMAGCGAHRLRAILQGLPRARTRLYFSGRRP